jgi:hypothetical protein
VVLLLAVGDRADHGVVACGDIVSGGIYIYPATV